MSDEPKYRDEQWLREQYVEQQRSRNEISEDLDCHPMTVGRWLKRFDIEVRSKTEHLLSDPRLEDPDWLRERYFDDGWDQSDIAEECGCHTSTVSNWFTRHGIEDQRSGSKLPDERLDDPQWLREQYVQQEKGMIAIAEECGCGPSTVRNHLLNHGIETRSWPGGITGKDHPLWNGGNQRYGDGWTETKRKAVRERDDHTCQDPRCSVTQADHLDEYDEQLHVHHLRKARDVDGAEERNAPENLITLCRDCHRRWEKIADAGLVPQGVAHGDD